MTLQAAGWVVKPWARQPRLIWPRLCLEAVWGGGTDASLELSETRGWFAGGISLLLKLTDVPVTD